MGLLGEVTVQGSHEGEDHQLRRPGEVKNIGLELGLMTRSSEEETSCRPEVSAADWSRSQLHGRGTTPKTPD